MSSLFFPIISRVEILERCAQQHTRETLCVRVCEYIIIKQKQKQSAAVKALSLARAHSLLLFVVLSSLSRVYKRHPRKRFKSARKRTDVLLFFHLCAIFRV